MLYILDESKEPLVGIAVGVLSTVLIIVLIGLIIVIVKIRQEKSNSTLETTSSSGWPHFKSTLYPYFTSRNNQVSDKSSVQIQMTDCGFTLIFYKHMDLSVEAFASTLMHCVANFLVVKLRGK